MRIYLEQLKVLWGDPVDAKTTDLSIPIGPICTDSRKLTKGSFFVPLIGEKFNGHSFLTEAFECGAQAVVVSRDFKQNVPSDFLHWIVDDTLKAYQQLALLYRSALDIPVIAITGSVGKTTTRELIKGVISPLGSIATTSHNNNNDVGVPLTLLNAKESHSAIVVEMGMRGLGEIQRLSCCSNPDVAVITNIGTAHIGRLGSREKIALAKCEITCCLNPSGVVIIPANDQLLGDVLPKFWKGRIIKVGISDELCSDLQLPSGNKISDISQVDLLGRVDLANGLITVDRNIFKLPLEGKHNAMNFMLALAVAIELGVDFNEIKDIKIDLPSGRSGRLNFNGITVLDETYNSSPESVRASLELLVSKSGRHFAVLGTMLELGDYSIALHRQVGELVEELSLDGLIIVSTGSEAKAMAIGASSIPYLKVVSTPEEAFDLLSSWLKPGDVLLLKASRGVGLEKIIASIQNYF